VHVILRACDAKTMLPTSKNAHYELSMWHLAFFLNMMLQSQKLLMPQTRADPPTEEEMLEKRKKKDKKERAPKEVPKPVERSQSSDDPIAILFKQVRPANDTSLHP
jgi:hypothetical protein